MGNDTAVVANTADDNVVSVFAGLFVTQFAYMLCMLSLCVYALRVLGITKRES